LPFKFDIDYVKVYQQKQVCSSKTFSNNGSSTNQSKVYQDVSISNSALTSGTHHICGQNFVLLDNGFEVSGSST
jgi:hypothetical protein